VKTQIALVDDHPLFRQGLRSLIERQEDLIVVGEADDARQAYELAEAKRPDVIVVDMNLPGVDGITATRELCQRVPEGKVLILSMYEDQNMVSRALAAGASGYAIKSQSPDLVLEAIRSVARGERYLAPSVASAASIAPGNGDDSGGPLATLSRREREVFHLLVRGFSNQRAAKELCISIKTVETHRTHIHRKLGIHSVAELIRFAAKNNLLPM
jgi:two-component system response regulator NreC